MTETTKAALIATGIVLGAAFLIGDLHRTILQAVWPVFQDLYNYYIAF